MTTKFRADRMLKLADFLEKLPRKSFNFGAVCDGEVIPSKKNPHPCGTVGCAIGWTPAVFPRLVKWFKDKNQLLNVKLRDGSSFEDDYRESFDDIASELFGINYADAGDLFLPEIPSPADKTTLCGDATPKQVAKRIRNYVKWKEKQLSGASNGKAK